MSALVALIAVGTSFTIAEAVKVRASSGDAAFPNIFAPGSPAIENDFDAEWVTFDAGTQFGLIASIDKTDTFIVAVEGEDDEGKLGMFAARGLILRRMSFEKLVKASAVDAGDVEDAPSVPQPEVEEVAEASEPAAEAAA